MQRVERAAWRARFGRRGPAAITGRMRASKRLRSPDGGTLRVNEAAARARVRIRCESGSLAFRTNSLAQRLRPAARGQAAHRAKAERSPRRKRAVATELPH